uniref:Putative metalloprotease n=1 Tax=Ixodes ricinus TaxID=34613 RepID=A0A0K8R4G3_IXORI
MYLTALIIVSIAPAHAGDVPTSYVVYPILIESRSDSSQGAVQVTEDYIINLEESSVLGENLFFTDTLNGVVTHELEGYLNFTHGIKPLRINDRSGRIPHKYFPFRSLRERLILRRE